MRRESSTAAADSETRHTYVEACLLVAELHRIDFEDTPSTDHRTRRRLGEQIDEAAMDGLAALADLEPSSERFRLEADLLATLIRSKFRGKKYRNKMESAARDALALDANNAEALVSLAKPRLFAPGRNRTDLEAGLELLTRALAIDAESETAHLLKGRALDELGRRSEAIAAWRKALEINPDSHPARDLLDRP